MKKIKRHFAEWKPAVSPGQVFSGDIGLNELQFNGGNLYWIEMRPSEKGRYAVVKMDGKEKENRDIIPPDFNARTRVHEYGGGSYTVFNKIVYFSNFRDQRIYRCTEGSSKVQPLTPGKNKDGSLGKYASLTVSPDGRWLLFVYEKEHACRENENFVALLDLSVKKNSEPEIIAKGCDFYAAPVFSPDGRKISWLQWNHPDMPWDSTELIMGNFSSGRIKGIKKIDGGKGISICFPDFDEEGRLYYIKDFKARDPGDPENWWNIYRYTDKIEMVTSMKAEFGEPHWVFGQSNYGFLSDGKIAAKMLKDEKDCLVVIDPETGTLTDIETGLCSYRCIRTDNKNSIFFLGAGSRKSSAVYSMHMSSGKQTLNFIKSSSHVGLKDVDISTAEPIEYPTKDGGKAYAFFYRPRNSRFTAPKEEKPPLLVMAHGGPTARTNSSFSPVIQFWTTAGFSVVDVNYRGSTGYGRRYRDALLSRWGLIDTSDVADAVRYLLKNNMAAADKVVVRGGSAGGYMVQRIMTEYPDLIKAGASYYGIGNLVTLAEQTHKFESRYIDNLLGEKFSLSRRRYKRRSPVNYMDRLKAPMIIFQGSDDRIVTPECSREIASALKKLGIRHEYVEYAGESHGFRSKENRADSLKKEFAFYRRLFLNR
ncbi:MAG TPA: prolyl oligopeptidase family serine peptidase [bacterium]|nr:prolyl oligopeptidase family serine peptidase [bacterium]